MSHRPLAIGVTAALALGGVATAAAADVTTIGVTASAGSGSRQFYVENLAGQPLTALDLGTSGQGSLFQTRVRDTNFGSPNAGFTASAEMTNLYRKTSGTIDYATKVDSAKLSVSYAAVPTDVAGVSLAALPKVTIAGLLPTCSALPTLLPAGSPLLGTGGLLGGALATLGLSDAAAPLCTALGGAATGATAVPVEAADGVLVGLSEKIVDNPLVKPVSLTGATEAGNFDTPSYLGDGAGDPGKPATPPAARARKLLAGSANAGLNLNALVSPLIDNKPLFDTVPGAGDGLTSVSTVVAALQGSVDPAVASVGNALAGLSSADQTGVLGGLAPVAGAPVASLTSTLLSKISGTYRSFPRLTADLAGAATGTYTGTLTITFVQQ